jgi:hypothetical protein
MCASLCGGSSNRGPKFVVCNLLNRHDFERGDLVTAWSLHTHTRLTAFIRLWDDRIWRVTGTILAAEIRGSQKGVHSRVGEG